VPELPEVETMRRGILACVGGTIRDFAALPCTCKPLRIEPTPSQLRKRIIGCPIQAVERLGKRVVLQLASGDALVFEPRMTGLVLVADPPDAAHLRVRIDLANTALPSIWYWDRRGLGSVRLFAAAQLAAAYGADNLGRDALAITLEQFRQALSGSRREIKVALLDQRAVAGVGNLYASEILHRARVHPTHRCDQLKPSQWVRIYESMRHILHDAIVHEGSTLSDGTYRNALNKAGGYQNCHVV
jgi:formamidopyrimidine-DNA glycosylase